MNITALTDEQKEAMVIDEVQEVDYILQDIFADDEEGCSTCIEQLCEEEGIAYDPELVGDEINDLIIEQEDRLIELYAEYQKE